MIAALPNWLWVILGLVGLGLIAFALFNHLAKKMFGDTVVDSRAPLAVGEVQRFLGHSGGVTSIAMSADGARLLSGSKDGTFRLWDVASGEARQVFRGTFGQVMHVALSKDGSQALVLCNQYHFRELRALADTISSIFSALFFSSYRRGIVPNATRSRFFLWDLGRDLNLWEQAGAAELNSVAFSPDGQRAATGSFEGAVRIWDVNRRVELYCLAGHEGATNASFSADGQRLITIGHQDKAAILWDLSTGKEIRQFRGHSGHLFDASLSKDGRRVV